jgi:hypothetical protein
VIRVGVPAKLIDGSAAGKTVTTDPTGGSTNVINEPPSEFTDK